MRSGSTTYIGDCIRALLAILLATAAVASVIAVLDSAAARRQLHYGFAPIPREPEQVLEILRSNAAVLIPLLVMAAIVQMRWICRTPLGGWCFTVFCDLVLSAIVLHDVVFALGTSLGAYGLRMARVTLPAGPIELLAYAVGASVYLQSRRRRMRGVEWLTASRVGLLAAVTLTTAAIAEVYLSP